MKRELTENEYKALRYLLTQFLDYLNDKEYTKVYNFMHGALANDFLRNNLDALMDEIQEHYKL